MNEISLCTGIGGFGLAARWMGWQSVATCEIDPFCQRVLKKNFPKAYHHSNLFTLTADILETEIQERFGPEWRKPGVILTAGLPCQPFSVAGERNGQNDPRFLWPTAIGLVRELRPDVLLFENVGGLLSILEPDSVSEMERETFELFYKDDNQSRKIVERVERRIIGRIITDIEQAGYVLPRSKDGTPIVFCIPACAVEAIHQRDRVWIVAYAASGRGWGTRRVQRPGTLRKADKVRQAEKFTIGGNDDGFYSNPESTIGQRARDTWSRRNGHTDARGDIGGVHSNAVGARRPQLVMSAFAGGQGYGAGSAHADDTNTSGGRRQNGRYGTQQEGNGQADQHRNGNSQPFEQVEWQPNDTSEILRIAYGIPGGMDGRVRNRNARIKALGNAIVPQVAYQIFQAINTFQNEQTR